MSYRDCKQKKKRSHFQSKRMASQKSAAKETWNFREIFQDTVSRRQLTRATKLAHKLLGICLPLMNL